MALAVDCGVALYNSDTVLFPYHFSAKKLLIRKARKYGNVQNLSLNPIFLFASLIPYFMSEQVSLFIRLLSDFLGYEPFAKCTSLSNVTFEEGIKAIPHHLFASCSGLNYISIPDTANCIGSNAFSNCNSLRRIDIPSSVTNIDKSIIASSSHAVIYCFKDSAAHIYADENALPYVLLDGDANEIINKTNDTTLYNKPTSDMESDSEVDTNSDVTTDVSSENDTESDIDSVTDTDTDPATDAGTETSDTAPNSDTDSQNDTDSGSDTDNESKQTGTYGDPDGDGDITANDALAVLHYSVGMADADSPINKPVAA